MKDKINLSYCVLRPWTPSEGVWISDWLFFCGTKCMLISIWWWSMDELLAISSLIGELGMSRDRISIEALSLLYPRLHLVTLHAQIDTLPRFDEVFSCVKMEQSVSSLIRDRSSCFLTNWGKWKVDTHPRAMPINGNAMLLICIRMWF